MKTNFPRNSYRNSYKSNQNKRYALIVLAVMIAAAFMTPIVRGQILRAASPIWSGENFLTRNIKSAGGFFSSREALIKENEDLKNTLSSYDNLLLSCRLIESSKDSLLQSLGREPQAKGIMASVLVRPPKTPFDTLVIDAGEKENVVVGQTAALPDGPLLGRVFQSFQENAQIVLFSTAGEKTDAILERENLPVTLIGRGGGNFEIDVPRDTLVVKGDRVLSPGVDSKLIAVVGDIESTPTDAFKTVLAASPVNLNSVRLIEILP